MPQRNPTDPTDGCPRCSIASVCSSHEQHATDQRPTTATLLGVITRDQGAARGTSWRVTGNGNPINTPTHD